MASLMTQRGSRRWGGAGKIATKAASHGAFQGTVAEISGGDFRDGFVGAAFSYVVGAAVLDNVMPVNDNSSYGDILLRGAAEAAVGGTAAAIGGGKFANGAYSAAFVYAFNRVLERNSNSPSQKGRGLHQVEVQDQQLEYGNTIDYKKVRLYFDATGDFAYVDNSGNIHFPNSLSSCADLISCKIPNTDTAFWLTHEMKHVQQAQQGMNLAMEKIINGPWGSGPYFTLQQYKNTPNPIGLNFEEQADWHAWNRRCRVTPTSC